MTVHDLNSLPADQLRSTLMNVCGATGWVERMLPLFPFEDLVELIESAEEQWYRCSANDWKEAFASHPKIGDKNLTSDRSGISGEWATQEQAGANNAATHTVEALAEGNRKYADKFGYIFIVSANGKSADEMLDILTARLRNAPEAELQVAAEEQNKIIRHRLEKLLA